MSTARDFHVSQNVSNNNSQVNSSAQDCPLNDVFGNYDNYINNCEAVQHTDNRYSTTTMIEIPQHYSTECHVKKDYQNEYFVHPKGPNSQTIQHFDKTSNRQEHHERYGLTSTAAYAYDVDFNPQNLIFPQSNNLLPPDNKIDVPKLIVPQGQDVKYNMSSNYFTTASQEYDLSKAIYPIRKKSIQKSMPLSITVKKSVPDGAYLYSEREVKKILNLPLTLGGKIVPRNLYERIVYELLARNISREKFAANVLGRSSAVFHNMVRSSNDWDKLGRTRREQYDKMKEWLDMSEDQKKATVERENRDEKSRTVFTQEQRDALESHFKEFPEARKPELVGLAYELRLPWDVVSTYFTNQRSKCHPQKNQ